MKINKANIAIIGGGCAGLSTAVALADRGFKVTIFEASPQLGGRARTVVVENNKQMYLLDNGQHILLGAYRETLALLRKVGIKEQQAFMRLPLQMTMQSSTDKLLLVLKSAHLLPAPFNMLFAFIRCQGLSFAERFSVIKLMVELKKNEFKVFNDTKLEDFLVQKRQSINVIELLWEPLCLAALNTPIKSASTRIFLNVLHDSFVGNKKMSDFLLPKLDLSQIISQPTVQYLQAKGVAIGLNTRVRGIEADQDGFSVETKVGKTIFSHVVLAVSPNRVAQLVENLPKLNNTLEQLKTYLYQPIYTVYLQYPAEIKLPRVMTGMVNSHPEADSHNMYDTIMQTDISSQWIFDRGQLTGQKGLIAVIVSAQGRHQALTHDELALKIAKEVFNAFPYLPKPLWHKVIAEKRATFSCVPNLARPTNKTAQPKLFLAGDYTYADYPATIEGAVRSGIKCAELIANN